MINIVFLATPEIAVNSLAALAKDEEIDVRAVVTMPDRPAGRGCCLKEPPVKKCAKEYGLTVYQTPSVSKDAEIMGILKNLNPDFCVTFAFGQLLSQDFLDIPKFCTINLHASLLPKYRGANPIQQAVINGDSETGITTMKTVKKMDAGDICLTEKIKIGENSSVPKIVDEISQKAPALIIKTLKDIYNGKLVSVPQNEDEVTFAPKFTKEDGLIDFNLSAKEFHNKVRGLQPWPVAYLCRNGKNIQVLETQISDMPCDNAKQGEILCIGKDGMAVKCSDKAILIKTVKPESKGKLTACDFANGKRLKKGDVL
ncbi:MAG: methionyl-tRNA formyltransferase [Candidatus Gastranaerophilales bacterium]|nr:methionyl-tRNA formyltransferase [Candidatus Gastranaerophilales bacterium]